MIKHVSCASREHPQAFDHRDWLTRLPSMLVSPSSAKQIQHFRLSGPPELCEVVRTLPELKLMTDSDTALPSAEEVS